MSEVMEGAIDFSNQDIQSSSGNFSGDREWRRLKFEAGKSYRIKFIDKTVEMRYRHYNPVEGKNIKGYYRCLRHTGYCPACVAATNGFGGDGKYKLKPAQEYFGANILVYTTDAQGQPIQPLNAEVYFWGFNSKKFVELRSIQQECGDLTELDLKLTCADQQAERFQDVSIIPITKCLYNMDAAFKAQCDAKIEKDKYPLAKMMCKEVDMQQMIELFGLPQSYLPQDMLAQMPQGQQTVSDLANGTVPTQSVQTYQASQAQPQMAPQPAPQAPVQQMVQPAPAQTVYSAAQMGQVVQPVPQQVSQVQPMAPEQPLMQTSQVQPQAQVYEQPVQQMAPQQPIAQEQPQAPSDAFADLNALQDILS